MNKIRLPNYYIQSGNKWFRYADGHFCMADDLPRGHRGLKEALRSLEYAKTISVNPRIVRVTLHIEEVTAEQIDAEMEKNIRQKLKESFTDSELEYLRQRKIL